MFKGCLLFCEPQLMSLTLSCVWYELSTSDYEIILLTIQVCMGATITLKIMCLEWLHKVKSLRNMINKLKWISWDQNRENIYYESLSFSVPARGIQFVYWGYLGGAY